MFENGFGQFEKVQFAFFLDSHLNQVYAGNSKEMYLSLKGVHQFAFEVFDDPCSGPVLFLGWLLPGGKPWPSL